MRRWTWRVNRTPGERAFDRVLICMVLTPLALGALGSFGLWGAAGAGSRVVVALEAVLWLWLARGVALAWRDPVARVLRFSSLILLILFGLSLCVSVAAFYSVLDA